ncbi:Fcf1-domain-containing protein [Sphaerosporella brunnea]|uniref:U three protein 23 n=1 Tax=Sphaerosporella brunnea TaxID=1250544 RepID=A0A5J5EIA3_9PEZI|nr:Fcf1-domain-containing protein [Sphaerosporella brunnea]
MRGKRGKAYKKLMAAYHQTFGFREPYQVLVDTEMVKEATRCTMGLPAALERTLRGTVKPMITQCSIRHLYALSTAEHPNKEGLIAIAKGFERRKCNHHELEQPLPEKECIESVSLKNGHNKHRYVLAVQNKDIRALFRDILGAPTIIINRSVMILEAMNAASRRVRDGTEREKFKAGIVEVQEKKKKKKRGPKGPNPLSVKKKAPKNLAPSDKPAGQAQGGGDTEGNAKKKRKRKHGKGGEGGGQPVSAEAAISSADN